MSDISRELLRQSIIRELTLEERSKLVPNDLMLFAVSNTLTASERAKLSPTELFMLSVHQDISVADRGRLKPEQLMQYSVHHTLTASERAKLSASQLAQLAMYQDLSEVDRGRLTAVQLRLLPTEPHWNVTAPYFSLAAIEKIYDYRNKANPEDSLDLAGMGMTHLPPEIKHLTGLRRLDLSSNQLTTLPEEIEALSGLEVLLLSDNHFSTLPPQIFDLKSLRCLVLSHNQIATLPPEIQYLTSLEELNLWHNTIASLPPEIKYLTKLKELLLSSCHLSILPREIGNLKSLDRLMVGNNALVTLPAEIEQLTSLSELDLSTNQLTSLPPEFRNLESLTKLDLSNNQLRELPPGIGNLFGLRDLRLSGNKLTSLPPSIQNLSSLIELSLSSNELATLPPEIEYLFELRELRLSGNKLTTLPEEFQNLVELRELRLAHNKLSTLPKGIQNLTALTLLDVQNNQLTSLPTEMQYLTALKELYLHGNHGLGIPAEVLGPTPMLVQVKESIPASPQEILEYYFEILGELGRALREVKLILVGRGEVGKTSMADVLQGRPFIEHRNRTNGISISCWNAPLQDGPAKIFIWDFGGQEIMHGTHQFFLTRRSLYIVMVDGRHDHAKQDAEYWLKLVRAFGGNSSIFVVMNRQNIHSFDLDRQYFSDKYGVKLEHFFRTDFENPLDIVPVREALLKESEFVLNQEERFPAKCWDVKSWLETMREDFLSNQAYEEICRRCRVTDTNEQKKLLHRLADLGTVVSFPDKIRLSELTVLKPDWVTDGIYRVITNKALCEEKHGKLDLNTLRRLLPKDRWPQLQHLTYLLELMKEFELCFAVEGERDTVLVPELLDDKTPPLSDWNPGECAIFVYKYGVLPHGVLPRFTTKLNKLSQAALRWRSGVVIAYDSSEALIKADYESNVISILVRGPYLKSRRGLFAIVRQNFDEIHSGIKELNPEELVAVPGYPSVTVSYRDLILDERRGKATFPVTLDGKRVDFRIAELLEGVESQEERFKANDDVRIQINCEKYYEKGHDMSDDHSIHARDIINSQVGQTLKNCTNNIQQLPPGERKEQLDALRVDVTKLIENLPDDKKDKAPKVAKSLETLVEQATSAEPDREWYSLSAKGLLDASKWVKDFSSNIGGTILNLGKTFWGDFVLPS